MVVAALSGNVPRELIGIVVDYARPRSNVPLCQIDYSIGAMVDVRLADFAPNPDKDDGKDQGRWRSGIILGHSVEKSNPMHFPDGWLHNNNGDIKQLTGAAPRWVFVKLLDVGKASGGWYRFSDTPFRIQPHGWITSSESGKGAGGEVYEKNDLVFFWDRRQQLNWRPGIVLEKLQGSQWRIAHFDLRQTSEYLFLHDVKPQIQLICYEQEIKPVPKSSMDATLFQLWTTASEMAPPNETEAATRLLCDNLNFYTLLGVPPNASAREIQKAFQRLHPTHTPGHDSRSEEDTFSQRRAWKAANTLLDPHLRRIHDQQLAHFS